MPFHSSTGAPSSSPAPRARSIWRRGGATALFIIAPVLVLLIVFYQEERVRGKVAWHEYRTKAQARGVKLALAEYIPPAVPDDRNFAAIPIFQDAFRDPPPPNPFALPSAFEPTPPKNRFLPGEFIDLAAWQSYFVDAKTLPVAGENAGQDVLQALERYAPQFEQLHLAGQRPDCRFPVRYEDGFGIATPQSGPLLMASQLYALRLSAHLALGQNEAATEDFFGGLRLYTATRHEPTVAAGAVRLSELNSLESAVWNGLAHRQWNVADLVKIEAALSDLRLLDDCALSLGSERGICNSLHEEVLRQGSGKLAEIFSPGRLHPGGPQPSLFVSVSCALYPMGWVRLSQAKTHQYFDEMLASITPDPPRVDIGRLERLKADTLVANRRAGLFRELQYVLFGILVPGDYLARSYAWAQTQLDETRLGCALERYRQSHQEFPASLDALVPGLLPTLPRDVITGEPLHYRLEPNGGYTIYSVGWNQEDDGGEDNPDVKSPPKQLDWVWTMPAPETKSPQEVVPR